VCVCVCVCVCANACACACVCVCACTYVRVDACLSFPQAAQVCPQLRVVVYSGDKESRAETRAVLPDERALDVLVCAFDTALRDADFVAGFSWAALVRSRLRSWLDSLLGDDKGLWREESSRCSLTEDAMSRCLFLPPSLPPSLPLSVTVSVTVTVSVSVSVSPPRALSFTSRTGC
jgi:hypothetical protein